MTQASVLQFVVHESGQKEDKKVERDTKEILSKWFL